MYLRIQLKAREDDLMAHILAIQIITYYHTIPLQNNS